MPSYKFECEKCKGQFERIVSLGIKECPCKECRGNAKKVFALSNIMTKGTFGETHL